MLNAMLFRNVVCLFLLKVFFVPTYVWAHFPHISTRKIGAKQTPLEDLSGGELLSLSAAGTYLLWVQASQAQHTD